MKCWSDYNICSNKFLPQKVSLEHNGRRSILTGIISHAGNCYFHSRICRCVRCCWWWCVAHGKHHSEHAAFADIFGRSIWQILPRCCRYTSAILMHHKGTVIHNGVNTPSHPNEFIHSFILHNRSLFSIIWPDSVWICGVRIERFYLISSWMVNERESNWHMYFFSTTLCRCILFEIRNTQHISVARVLFQPQRMLNGESDLFL